MKKIMTIAAAAATMLAVADGVESGIVGYNTIPSISKGQYVALGIQFENCAGGAIPVKDLVSVGSIQGSGSIGGADQIWRWNTASATWTKYFYYSSRGVTRWVESTDTTTETTDTVPAGETVFFLRNGSATTLTLAGAVKAMEGASSVTVSKGQLAFMSNPWPTPVSVASFNSNYATGSTPQGSGSIGGADQIWRWNTSSSTWTKYFYYSSRGVTRWVESTDTTTETTDTIPAGEGFFFQRAGASATISIAAPSAN